MSGSETLVATRTHVGIRRYLLTLMHFGISGRISQGREGKGREGKGREGKGREGKGRKGKERKGKERKGKGREGKGREGKGREGKGRENHLDMFFHLHTSFYSSWDKFAKYDIPATLNFILSTSGAPSLSYIGHSQGTTIAFAEFSSDQTWLSKVDIYVALAPVAFAGNMISPIAYLAPFSREIEVCSAAYVLFYGAFTQHG